MEKPKQNNYIEIHKYVDEKFFLKKLKAAELELPLNTNTFKIKTVNNFLSEIFINYQVWIVYHKKDI